MWKGLVVDEGLMMGGRGLMVVGNGFLVGRMGKIKVKGRAHGGRKGAQGWEKESYG